MILGCSPVGEPSRIGLARGLRAGFDLARDSGGGSRDTRNLASAGALRGLVRRCRKPTSGVDSPGGRSPRARPSHPFTRPESGPDGGPPDRWDEPINSGCTPAGRRFRRARVVGPQAETLAGVGPQSRTLHALGRALQAGSALLCQGSRTDHASRASRSDGSGRLRADASFHDAHIS